MNFKREAMPLFHFGPIELEFRHGSSARVVIPSIGKQDATDIDEQAGDIRRFLHRVVSVRVMTQLCGEKCQEAVKKVPSPDPHYTF